MSIIHWPFEKWLDNVALAALSNRETVRESYDRARNVIERGVPGDFVECGVYGGAQCAAMARAIWDTRRDQSLPLCGVERHVHLFDSFAGVPAPGEHDTDIEPHMVEEFNRGTTCPLDSVKDHMREWGLPEDLFVYHEGLFENVVPWAKLGPIAILRLDGDWYESVRVCLEHLLPLVSRGGWVIVDDWGLAGARKAADEFINHGPAYFQVADEKGGEHV